MNNKANIEIYKNLLESIKRDGVEELVEYLFNETDIAIAPASSKHHCSYPGGLIDHSLNVYNCLIEKLNNKTFEKIDVRLESLKIVALLHDLCKVNFYESYKRNQKNEETGQWEKVDSYRINDLFPYGHGEKSVSIVSRFIDLTEEEMMAIRWHMGFTEPKELYSTIGQAFTIYPLALLLFEADLEATYILEKEVAE